MVAVPQKVLDWTIARFVVADEDGYPDEFRVYYRNSVDGSELLESFKADCEQPEATAQTAYDAAYSDCVTRAAGMPHRYVIEAWVRGDSVPKAQHPFLIQSPRTAEIDLPSDKGIIQQAIRHTEQMQRTMQSVYESTAGQMVQTIQRLSEENDRLKLEREQVWRRAQQLEETAFQRERLQRQDEASAQRTEMLFQMLVQVAPALVSGLMTRPQALPSQPSNEGPAQPHQPAVVIGEATAQWLWSLSDEERATLLASVSPERRAELETILTAKESC